MKKQLLVLTAFFSVFGNSMNAGWSLSGSSAVSKTISKAIVNPETVTSRPTIVHAKKTNTTRKRNVVAASRAHRKTCKRQKRRPARRSGGCMRCSRRR